MANGRIDEFMWEIRGTVILDTPCRTNVVVRTWLETFLENLEEKHRAGIRKLNTPEEESMEQKL